MSKQDAQNGFNYSHAGWRVFLSKPGATCGSEFLEAVRRSERLHQPWVFPPRSHDEYGSHLERIRSGRTIAFLVRRKSDECLAGTINVSEPVMGVFCRAYLGFCTFTPFQGQGYMTEGLSLVLDYAFEELGFHRLEANIQPANLASSAFVRRLGFRKEGFSPRYLMIDGAWRDHERWAILSEEWPEHRHRLFASRLADGRES
jgi:ribosomal-protein-alanine N-acetyltransferase